MNDLLGWIENEASRGLTEGDSISALTAIKWKIKDSALSTPPAAVESNGSVELEDARAEAADSLRVLDAIAEYVGCPHDEELTVDHVRQHYMKLENAAQRQGIEDAGRIANAQAYYASAETRLREALRPFVTACDHYSGEQDDEYCVDMDSVITLGHLRDARAAAFSPAVGNEAKKSEGGVESKTGGSGRCPLEYASGTASQGETAEATGKDALADIAQAVKPAQPAASDRRISEQPETAYSADRQISGVAPGPSGPTANVKCEACSGTGRHMGRFSMNDPDCTYCNGTGLLDAFTVGRR